VAVHHAVMTSAAPTGYRAVLGLPGVTPLVALSLLARIPASAAGIVLTLHVVLTLDLGYAAAGAVGAASTVGMALGAPLLGRLVDRRGLRTMLAVTVVAEALFWGLAPALPYPALLGAALVGGLLSTPVYSVIRQSLAALVPEAQRRPAFALDSMAVEVSYIVGPAAGSLMVVQLGSPATLYAVGAAWVVSGLALWVLDPATRAGDPADDGAAPTSRRSSHSRTAGVLLIFGTELSVIAAVQVSGPAYAIAVVNAVWCTSSLVGGFVYGAATRTSSVFALVAALGGATLLVGLGGPWWSFALLLVPAGLLTAPSLAASSERVSVLAPEPARGVVTGLHGSAITLGAAVGTPLAGLLIDVASPNAAVVVIGVTGIGLAGVAALVARPAGRPA
jgi:MFS family permease